MFEINFDNQNTKYGYPISVDFSNDGQTIITSTSSGWVLVWDIHLPNQIKASFRIINGVTGQPERINIIRDINEVNKIATYSIKT